MNISDSMVMYTNMIGEWVMNTYFLYICAFVLFGVSFYKDKKKTKKALMKAKKSLLNILPQFLGVILFVGVILSIIDTNFISKLIGSESGFIGVCISAIVGSITLIPGFIAFPTADLLIQNGAGYMQIGAFISTLMMVGVATFTVEKEYFGVKTTVVRNTLAFLFSFIVAIIIGKVVG